MLLTVGQSFPFKVMVPQKRFLTLGTDKMLQQMEGGRVLVTITITSTAAEQLPQDRRISQAHGCGGEVGVQRVGGGSVYGVGRVSGQ